MIYIFYIIIFFSLACKKSAAGAKEKSVNLNLETVLEFDNKNLDSDVKIIDNVQEFLTKVRSVLDKSKNFRRSFNDEEVKIKNLKFTDFLEYVINHILMYNDKELEEIAVIIDEEIRKYHYKGCKFYELMENNDAFRDFMTDTLEEMKHLRGKKLRKHFKNYVKKIKARDFQKKDLDLILYINSLYRVDSNDKMNNVIKHLKDFSKTSRRNHKDLVKVVRKGLRSMIFDHYSNLNANARRDLKMKISNYLIEYTAGKNGKGKIVTYGTVTEIEYLPTKSVKEKRKHERHGRNREDKTTTESDVMITPNRNLEQEKNMMPFRFISLYTEEIPTTTKKPKTTKRKHRRHKNKGNKPEKKVESSLERESEPETTSKKAEVSLEQESKTQATSQRAAISPELKREFKSKKVESSSAENTGSKIKSKKSRNKIGHPKTVMVVREGRPLREILTEHNAIIRVMSSRTPQQVRMKGLNRALRKIKKNREDKIKKQRHALRDKPVDLKSKGDDGSQEKTPDNKHPVKTKPKAKVKLLARDSRESQIVTHSHVKEEKPIKVNKRTHKVSIKHNSRKSKQHKADNTDSFLQRAKASDSVDEDYSRRERPATSDAEEPTNKDQQRKSFLDTGLPIESFENNVLDRYYEYRKQNQYDTFKSNKRSLIRKRNKGRHSRARETRYRKNLPINEINKIEGIDKVSNASQKPTESNINVTKKVPALQTEPLKIDDQKLLTENKPAKKTNNFTTVKFRSRNSDEKTEPTTVAFVSDTYIINKINNLEKQLEVVIDKMDGRVDRANSYDSIEQTTKFQQIPYWIGTPKTTRPSSSSSSSSEESSENNTLSNNNTSANLTRSHNADNTTAAVAKTGNGTLQNATLQGNNTSNNPNGTAVDKLTENLKKGNSTDGRKQGLHVDKLDEITSDKPSTVGSQTTSLNVSNTTSVEKEGTTKSDNALVTAINNNSTNNATSTTKNDKSDKTSKETADADSTKKDVNFRASEDDGPKEDENSTIKIKSTKDKIIRSDKEAKSTKNETKSTKEETYFRASENDLNEDIKTKKKRKPKQDKSSTKIDDKGSSSKSTLTTTFTTTINTTEIKNNETLKQDLNSTNGNAKEEIRNGQTAIEITTDAILGNKSTTISTKYGAKFTFSIGNVNITSVNKDIEDNSKNNSTSNKSRRMGRRKSVFSNPFDSDNDRLKTDREVDDTLYNWA